jgi:hypothetical protein
MPFTIRLLLISFLFIHLPAQSQVYLYGGYGMSFPNVDSLNFVVDRYNDNRSSLHKAMPHFENLNGFAFTVGKVGTKVDVGFSYMQRKQIVSGVEGLTGSAELQTDLKASTNALEMHIGFARATPGIALSTGMKGELGMFKVESRIAAPYNMIDREFNKIQSSLLLSAGLFVRIHIFNPGLVIEPYMIWPVHRVQVDEVNRYINPYHYNQDPAQIRIRPSGFGITFLAGFVLVD